MHCQIECERTKYGNRMESPSTSVIPDDCGPASIVTLAMLGRI